MSILSENAKLDASALVKTKDMFAKQYFEHTSPDGKTISDLVGNTGYEYIVIGENLALGNFTSSTDVVDAWMASPGHRANILNTRFTEIGIGVLQGQYEGRKVWIAVQHFGLPRSVCPSVSASLKTSITANEKMIKTHEAKLADLKREIDAEGNKNSENYHRLVDEYNALVNVYNTLIADTRAKINSYNAQVESVNSCIQGA